jgi:DNA polymerase
MTQFVFADSFESWRTEARRLIVAGVQPSAIAWTIEKQQPSLFGDDPADVDATASKPSFTVPPKFLDLARTVACHRHTGRWEILYRTLWRICHEEKNLLEIVTDDDVHALTQMRKAVTRDVHKMKAFVRFRRVESESGEENYIAWHRPDHRIVRLAAPFFSRRFKAMNWTILTPDESVTWNQSRLEYGAGVPVTEAPDEDALEELWLTYYASIFNPARVKVATMKREMPVRHWATLPEAALIDDLLRDAPARVDEMIERSEGIAETATSFFPESLELGELRKAAAGCTACPLHQPATQTVFGHGPRDARMIIVGEQPGDQEDIAGKPFVGPAGSLLNQMLIAAQINRADVYVTNVVKHFKFIEKEGTGTRGKHRLHKKPDSREIFACRPWLEAEIAAIAPRVLVCLGATAAQSLFGRDFQITKHRGQFSATEWCSHTIATWHPAAILRMPDSDRKQQMKQQMVQDLLSAGERF